MENLTNTENGKKYAIVSGVFYFLSLLINTLIDPIAYMQSVGEFLFSVIDTLIWCLMCLCLGIVNIKRNKKDVAIVGAIVVIENFVSMMAARVVIDWTGGYMYLTQIIAYIALIIPLIFHLEGEIIKRYIYFVPAIVYTMGLAMSIYDNYNYGYTSFSEVEGMMLMEGLACFFSCLWIRESIPCAKTSLGNNSSSTAFGGADQIKIYKDLLDSGAITQEEFDIKKKEILGL